MARHTINAAELFEPVEINLFGTVFKVREPTRDVEIKISDLSTELGEALTKAAEQEESEEASRKDVLPIYYAIFDALLEPAEVDGKKITGKAAVKELYDANTIGMSHMDGLVEKLRSVRQDRPT
jgi:hypothetical protein